MNFLAQLPKEQLVTQIQNGLILMVLGMGTVFVFLTLLVFLTKGLSALVKKVAPATAQPVTKNPATSVAAISVGDSEIAAVISAAVAKSQEK
ncbi:MAG: OadG family protein [Sphaerochaetaceae bacterium]